MSTIKQPTQAHGGKPPRKHVVLLEDLDAAVEEITGGSGKIYFGESQFDA